MVVDTCIESFQVRLLGPRGAAAYEDVSRSGISDAGGGRGIDTGAATVLKVSPHDYRLSGNGHRITKAVVRERIRGFHISLLAPCGSIPDKNVGSSGTTGIVIGRGIDAFAVAVLQRSAHDHRIPRNCDRKPELIVEPRIRGLQIGLLAPGGAVAHENVGRTRLIGVFVRKGVHSRAVAVLVVCAYHDGIPGNGDRSAEEIAQIGIRSFKIGLLRPNAGGLDEDIGRAGFSPCIVIRRIHTRAVTILQMGAHHGGVA